MLIKFQFQFQFQASLTIASSKPNSGHEKGSNQKIVMQINKESSNDTWTIKCYECKGQHIFEDCEQFTRSNVNNSLLMVKKVKVCFGCLLQGQKLNVYIKNVFVRAKTVCRFIITCYIRIRSLSLQKVQQEKFKINKKVVQQIF